MSLLALNSTPAERAVGCFFAENFESNDHVVRNGGTINGVPVLNFGGTFSAAASDYITYPNMYLGRRLLFSAAFKITTSVIARTAVFNNYDSSTSKGMLVDVLATGFLRASFNYNGSNYKYRDTSIAINDGVSHSILITFDGTTINLYVDGVLAQGAQSSLGILIDFQSAVSLGIGRSYTLAARFTGQIKYIHLFIGALDADDAVAIHNNTLYTYRNRAILDLPMTMATHDPTNVRTLDVSGNGNHATFGDGSTATTYPTKYGTRGYTYDGGDYLVVGSSTGFMSSTKQSFFALIDARKTGSLEGIFGNRNLTTEIQALFLLTTGILQYQVYSGGAKSLTSVSVIDGIASVGITVEQVSGSTTLKLYVNGKLERVSTFAGYPVMTDTNFDIGRIGSTNNLNGKIIQAVALKDYILSSIQVADLHIQMMQGVNDV